MLIGYEGVATSLVQLMRDRGAATARIVEKIMGLHEGEIRTPNPDPDHGDIHPVWVDVVSKGRFPTWMVVAQDTPLRRTAGQTGMDGVSDEVQFRYPFSILSHVVGKDEGDLAAHRYRLMMVIRVLLIQHKLLVKTDQSKAVMELQDMQEIVGGIARDDDSRYLMEGRTDFHVMTTEHIPAAQEPWGAVEVVQVAHQMMDEGS